MACTPSETQGKANIVEALVGSPLESKAFTWQELSAGDCHQTGGTMTFNSDGSGKFACTTWTDHTHTHDIWHSSFQVLRGDNTVLFPLGQYDGPPMSDGGPSYYWERPFNFEPSLYGSIAGVTQSYSC